MTMHVSNNRPEPDQLLADIAEYVVNGEVVSTEAYETARLCLMDTIGCGLLALRYPECAKHIGPIVPGTIVPNGARVPGTMLQTDPVTAAFSIGCMIRWLDYNDTWLAAEWGHPSDNLGGILAAADYVSRRNIAQGSPPLTMRTVLTAMIMAHEIQGVIALENSFNRVGLDHVILVKVATSAVVTHMLGGTKNEIMNAVSNAWIDGHPLRTYRHAPNTGPRKSWAAGDATSRGVRLALQAIKGEAGYPSALSAPAWGFYDVLFKGKPLTINRSFGSYVMENVLFKVSFPAEFHAQTAVECALQLHPLVKDRLEDIDRIMLTTHESALRIIDKTGPLHNPADRDHCLQYMVAIALLYGTLTADHYEDSAAKDPRIDALRQRMVTIEEKRYSLEYLDESKRSIANAVQVLFKDQTATEQIVVEYPIGHRRRRDEAIPLLQQKFESNLSSRFPAKQAAEILNLISSGDRLSQTPVHAFTDLFAI